ncbi:MAG: hypothetical protein JXR96_30835 [Deltaproteobacteria bacterium]|nr:hypothetical protein [Deltaproteobacteria bacterium]
MSDLPARLAILTAWASLFVFGQAGAQGADRKNEPSVAVHSIEGRGVDLTEAELDGMSSYLQRKLGDLAAVRIVPWEAVRRHLQSRDLYLCFGERACQVDVERALQADYTLAVSVLPMGGVCILTASLYPRESQATLRTASSKGACTREALVEGLDKVMGDLLAGRTVPFEKRARNPYLEKARKAYASFDFDSALQILQQALKHDSSDVEKAQIHLLLGLVRFTLGDEASAEREFKLALELDRSIEPPPDTSPKILASFVRIKACLPPPATEPSRPDEKPEPEVAKVDPERTAKPGEKAVQAEPAIVASRPAGRRRIWTWVLAGVGAAALASGGLCGGLALSAKSDFESARWADEAEAVADTYETRKLAANILFGTGGAILAAAVVMFFVEDMDADTGEGKARLGIAPAPAGIFIHASF